MTRMTLSHSRLKEALTERGAQDMECNLTVRVTGFSGRTEPNPNAIWADTIATVGLSNSEPVGQRVDRSFRHLGTINIAARIACGMTDAGLIEAPFVDAQRRILIESKAAISLGFGPATGAGADHISLAAQPGSADHAGHHREFCEALGSAAHRATHGGALSRWSGSRSRFRSPSRGGEDPEIMSPDSISDRSLCAPAMACHDGADHGVLLHCFVARKAPRGSEGVNRAAFDAQNQNDEIVRGAQEH